MPDNVLDTNALAEFLVQYYTSADFGRSRFIKAGPMSEESAKLINRIVAAYRSNAEQISSVIASTMAFVEIARRWKDIIQDRITLDQFRAFLQDPPEWFLVAAIDYTIIPFYCQLPASVKMEDQTVKSIEWTDAVHAATALSRNEPNQPRCRLSTSDSRLKRIELLATECI